MSQRKRPVLALLLALSLMGCMASPASMGSGAGIKGGGAQDIGLARAQISAGQVPTADQFRVEGLFSEHDLPLGEVPAGKTLGVTLGLGIAPLLPGGRTSHFIQVGLGTGLVDIKRPPQQIMVVADRSGSMSGPRIAALRDALTRLVGKLGEGDQLGLVLFDDSAELLMPLAPLGDKSAWTPAIKKVVERGGTDIEQGLKQGYELLSAAPSVPGTEKRIILITDAEPNVGATDEDSFAKLVSRNAERGIGLTAFGVGLDFRPEIAEAIGNQAGGNYVFLEDAAKLKSVFDNDFDFLVSPAAYDMKLTVRPARGFTIAEVYGAAAKPDAQGAYVLTLKTLFFSKHRGAIVLRLQADAPAEAAATAPNSQPAPEALIAEGSLVYTERDHVTVRDENVTAETTADRPVGATNYYSPKAVQKAVALTNMYLAMRAASGLYHGTPRKASEAVAVLEAAKKQIESARQTLQAEDLAVETTLLDSLIANCKK